MSAPIPASAAPARPQHPWQSTPTLFPAYIGQLNSLGGDPGHLQQPYLNPGYAPLQYIIAPQYTAGAIVAPGQSVSARHDLPMPHQYLAGSRHASSGANARERESMEASTAQEGQDDDTDEVARRLRRIEALAEEIARAQACPRVVSMFGLSCAILLDCFLVQCRKASELSQISVPS
jgi:hypothetical protein